MQRTFAFAGAAALMVVALTACGSSATGSGNGTGSPTSAATTAAPRTPSTPTQDSKPTNLANPCKLVTAADLISVFGKGSTFSLVDTDNPPVTESFEQRACGYTGTVPGIYSDNPNDGGAQLTIMVTTNVDDTNGTAWTAAVDGGKMAASGPSTIGSTEYRPVTNVGEGAFFSGPGWLTAHKGRVIIEVQSPDDTNGVLTDSKATAIVLRALQRVNS